jgi:uncharacterized protein
MNNVGAMSAQLCPVCEKPAVSEHRPFCSQGCRDRDLIQWLDGNRAIPGPAAEEVED